MKRKFLLLALLCLSMASWAQTDTTQKNNEKDTIRVGNMLIVKDGKFSSGDGTEVITRHYHRYYKPSNVSTNWCIIDLGFANYNDKTNYGGIPAQQFAPGATSDWFNLRNGKSVDVNIWLFIQRLNLISHVVNLKYGLGIELNNYRYSSPIV